MTRRALSISSDDLFAHEAEVCTTLSVWYFIVFSNIFLLFQILVIKLRLNAVHVIGANGPYSPGLTPFKVSKKVTYGFLCGSEIPDSTVRHEVHAKCGWCEVMEASDRLSMHWNSSCSSNLSVSSTSLFPKKLLSQWNALDQTITAEVCANCYDAKVWKGKILCCGEVAVKNGGFHTPFYLKTHIADQL